MIRITMIGGIASALEPFWFRGKGRLLRALCPRDGMAKRVLFGVPVELDLHDWVQRSIFLGVYEPEETKWLKEYLRPGMVVVDVGANVGYYTLLARAAVGPTGRVIAIEPSPRPARRLSAAVARYDNVSVITNALGASPGSGILFLDEGAANHTPTLISHPDASETPVTIETLDGCLKEHHIERVDLLKLDVEGWEPHVLAGAGRLLAERRIKAVLCEFNGYWLQRAGSSVSNLWQAFMDAGFRDARSSQSIPGTADSCETRLLLLDDSDRGT